LRYINGQLASNDFRDNFQSLWCSLKTCQIHCISFQTSRAAAAAAASEQLAMVPYFFSTNLKVLKMCNVHNSAHIFCIFSMQKARKSCTPKEPIDNIVGTNAIKLHHRGQEKKEPTKLFFCLVNAA
jgi:hypothetical protein